MAKPPSLRRLTPESFPEDQQELVDKIADSYNQFMEDTISVFNKGLSFENLNRELSTVDVTIDGSGNVVNPPSIKHNIRGKVEGLVCISAFNIESPNTYPNYQPYVAYSLRTGFIDIKAVRGLQNNSKYKLRLEIIGSSLA